MRGEFCEQVRQNVMTLYQPEIITYVCKIVYNY